MIRKFTIRLAAASALLATTAMGGAALAQAVSDPTVLQPISDEYQPKKTLWGDPDFTGTWPIDNIASIFFQRNDRYGNRYYLTEEELAQRAEQANASAERYKE